MDDHDLAAVDGSQHGLLLSNGSFVFSEEEEQAHVSDVAAIEDKISFLQMLQRVEVEPITFLPFGSEANILQSLLQIRTVEPESYLSPDHYKPFKLGFLSSSHPPPPSFAVTAANGEVKERRKRKRTRAPKNKEQVESQRMTHIAVERNRRRQMNEHLNSLKRLMPQSYLQRADQASVIGGAIDFIKELEQLLHSLEAEKRIKTGDGDDEKEKTMSSLAYNSSSVSSVSTSDDGRAAAEEPDVETTVTHNHVSLKVRCKRRQGQILRVIVSLEDLKLTILHLNITSSSNFVFHSFSLKKEEDCELGSADEITSAVHRIFKHINGG